MATADEICTRIYHQLTEEKVQEMVDERINDYLPDDWEDDYGDRDEAYSEVGRGGAESDTIREIIEAVHPAGTLTEGIFLEVYARVKSYYNLNDE